MEMPISHKSPSTSTASDGLRTRILEGITNQTASSPSTPSLRATDPFPADQSGNRERLVATEQRTVVSKDQASCGSQRPQADRAKETSYSAVKEEGNGTAQSFLESVESATPTPDESRYDAEKATDTTSCACCCRCGRVQNRRPEAPRARRSKSYPAVKTGIWELSGSEWEWRTAAATEIPNAAISFAPTQSPLERLPMEILDGIIEQLALDIAPTGHSLRNVDLVSCLLTSRTIHIAAIKTLYSHITIPHSAIFSKFLHHLSEYPGLGMIVRRLDLSQFTSVGLGRTRQMNAEVQNLTSTTLLKCLEMTPVIQEVLLQEHLENDIDELVLKKIFFDLPRLRAVDFCGASSPSFKAAFTSTIMSLTDFPSRMLGIRRLGFHECFTVPSSTFEALLPRLPYLTHLDVAHTHVTDKALMSIPDTARLTHLNLGRCNQISGDGVVRFITTHPAASGLIYLNLSCDIARYRLLGESHVDKLLPVLPRTLRSLNLNGAKIGASHVSALLPLTKHLEELGIAFADISMRDINSLFCPTPVTSPPREDVPWTPPALHYLDLTGITSVSQASLFSSSCALLGPSTVPLEVLELSDTVVTALRGCKATNKRRGWVVKDLGRRGWYVREPRSGDQGGRDGRRSWKMGARWWGMRKVPVAWGEVGGLYGHYMFKK